MNIAYLLETLNARDFQRRATCDYFGIELDEVVTCYHVTEAKNAESILATGLKAYECQQGRITRQAACYLFLDRNDINGDTIKVLGIETPVVIEAKLTVAQLIESAAYDGMFNATFDCAYSAIMYIDNIAPEAIK